MANAIRKSRATRTTSLVAALALVGLGACAGDDEDDNAAPAATSAPAVSTTTTVPEAPSAGCDSAADDVATGEQRIEVPSGATTRYYFRYVPQDYDGAVPLPVVVDLHGYLEGAEVHKQHSALGPYGDQQGFVTLTPHGPGTDGVPRWDTAATSADMTFIGEMLDDVEDAVCVDRARVFMTGLSNGAMMTSSIACAMSDRVAAVAPVAGVTTIEDCGATRPVPVVAFHGTADGFLAFDGGLGEQALNLPAPDGSGRSLRDLRVGGVGAQGPSVPDIMGDWATRNGCDSEPNEEEVADDVTLHAFPCPSGADVQLYEIEGGGHTWPGSEFSKAIESSVGPTTFSIDANEVMWEFFVAHPLP
jgi:polyhydroxybutyrate depolymerase